MKPSYHKLAAELLRKRPHVPRGLAVDFAALGIPDHDYQQKLDFLVKNKIFFASFPKSLDFQETKGIFEWINRSLAQVDLTREVPVPQLLKILGNLESLLTIVKEERMMLLFDQHKKLLEILWVCTDFDVILQILKMTLYLFKTKLKVAQTVIHNLSEEDLNRLFLVAHLWLNGLNLLQPTPLSFVQKFEAANPALLSRAVLDPADWCNAPINFADIEVPSNSQKVNKSDPLVLDLNEFRGLSMFEIVNKIEGKIGAKVSKQSLNFLSLKTRLDICQQLLWKHDGTAIDASSRQKLAMLNLSASTLVTSSAKNQDLSKSQEKVAMLFDPQVEYFTSVVPLEHLESFALVPYDEPRLFGGFVTVFYNYYCNQETTNEQVYRVKRFCQILIEKIHQETYGRQAGQATPPAGATASSLSFPLDMETLIEVLRLANLMGLNERKSAHTPNQIDISYILEMVHNIQLHFIERLKSTFDEGAIDILVEINRIFLQEVDRDKECVLFDLFADNLQAYLQIFYNHREHFTVTPDLYSTISILVFETIEALDSYFMDHLRNSSNFKVPKMARALMAAPFWENPELVELAVNYPSFSLIFNELIVLFHDLLNNLPDVSVASYVSRFSENGFLPLVIGRIGVQTVANEYDSLGFLVNLLSKVLLHNKDLVDDPQLEEIFRYFFEQIFVREAVVNNYKRFNGGDSNTALKNFADEVVAFCNIHSRFAPMVSKQLVNQIVKVKQINKELAYFAVRADSPSTLTSLINFSDLIVKKLGWFVNAQGRPMSEQDVAADFSVWQKTGANYLKFFSRFFDNLNTNIYNQIRDDFAEAFDGKPFLRFIVGCFANVPIYFDMFRKKKMVSMFVKTVIHTHNQAFTQVLKDNVFVELRRLAMKLKAAAKACGPKEFKEGYALLFQKSTGLKPISEFDFSAVTVNTKRLVKTYASIVCQMDVFKILLVSNRHQFPIAQLMETLPNLQAALAFVDLEFAQQSESVFKRHLIEELGAQTFELYFEGSKNPELFSFAILFKQVRDTFDLNASELLVDLVVRLSSYESLQPYKRNLPLLFLARNAEELDRLADEPALTYHTLISVHHNLTTIYEHINLSQKILARGDLPFARYTVHFLLSKIRFFSSTVPNLLKFLFTFIAKLKKQIKRIFLTKAEKSDIFLNHAFYIYMIDTHFAEILKLVQHLVEGMMATKHFEVPVTTEQATRFKDVGVSRTIELERMKMMAGIAAALRSIPSDAFEVLYLRDKPIEYFDASLARLKNKPPKPQNAIQSEPEQIQRFFDIEDKVAEAALHPDPTNNIPLKIFKSDLLSAFAVNFKALLDSLFTEVCKPVAIEDEAVPNVTKVLYKTHFSEIITDDVSALGVELGLLWSPEMPNPRHVQDLTSSNVPKTEDDLLGAPTRPFTVANPASLANFTEEAEKLKKEVDTSVEHLVIFFFNNWLHFAKARPFLRTVWEKFVLGKVKGDKEGQVAHLRKMLGEAQTALRLGVEGKSSRSRSKTEYRLVVKERESLLNILYLQMDLFGLIQSIQKEIIPQETITAFAQDINAIPSEEKTPQQPEESAGTPNPARDHTPQTPTPAAFRPRRIDGFVGYVLTVLHKCLNPKYKRDKLQKLIVAVLTLLEKLEFSLDEKLSLVETIQATLTFFYTRSASKDKERVLLVHEGVVRAIMSILCVIFENDEPFLDRFAVTNRFDVIRTLLKIRAENPESLFFRSEIQKQFKTLTEIILRQPHVLSLLVESEIKFYLYHQPDHQTELEKLATVFNKPFIGYERMVAQVVEEVCEVWKDEAGKQMVRLAKGQEFTIKLSDVKPHISEFVSVLMNDVQQKLQRPHQPQEHGPMFDHLSLCETLFFQVLPRYPIFYSSVMSKHKSLFVVHFVEKFLDIHPSFFQFVVPVFFDLPHLIKDPEGNILSVTRHIRQALSARLIQSLQTRLTELEGILQTLAKPELNKGEHSTTLHGLADALWGVDTILAFLLKAMHSENFNRELEHRDVLGSLVQKMEGVFLTASANPKIDLRHFWGILIFPEVLRRRQVIQTINPDEFTAPNPKDNTHMQLHVPTTFRFSPHNWAQSKAKNTVRVYLLSHHKEVFYDSLVPPTATQKMGLNHQVMGLRGGRRPGRFFRHTHDDEMFMRPMFVEHNFRIGRGQAEFVMEEDPEDGDIGEEDGEGDEMEIMSSGMSASSRSLTQHNRLAFDGATQRFDNFQNRGPLRFSGRPNITTTIRVEGLDNLPNRMDPNNILDLLANTLNRFQRPDFPQIPITPGIIPLPELRRMQNALGQLEGQPQRLVGDDGYFMMRNPGEPQPNQNARRLGDTPSPNGHSTPSNQERSSHDHGSESRGSEMEHEHPDDDYDESGTHGDGMEEEDDGTEEQGDGMDEEDEEEMDDHLSEDEMGDLGDGTDLDSDDQSDNTDEERISDDPEEGESVDDEEAMEAFEEDFGEEGEDDQGSESEDEEDEDEQVEFLGNEVDDIDIMIDIQSQRSSRQAAESVDNLRVDQQDAGHRPTSVTFRKLFTSYPYMLPLNLLGTTYSYYSDDIMESYRIILEARTLPQEKPGTSSAYRKVQKEFEKFKSIFLGDKNQARNGYRGPGYTGPPFDNRRLPVLMREEAHVDERFDGLVGEMMRGGLPGAYDRQTPFAFRGRNQGPQANQGQSQTNTLLTEINTLITDRENRQHGGPLPVQGANQDQMQIENSSPQANRDPGATSHESEVTRGDRNQPQTPAPTRIDSNQQPPDSNIRPIPEHIQADLDSAREQFNQLLGQVQAQRFQSRPDSPPVTVTLDPGNAHPLPVAPLDNQTPQTTPPESLRPVDANLLASISTIPQVTQSNFSFALNINRQPSDAQPPNSQDSSRGSAFLRRNHPEMVHIDASTLSHIQPRQPESQNVSQERPGESPVRGTDEQSLPQIREVSREEGMIVEPRDASPADSTPPNRPAPVTPDEPVAEPFNFGLYGLPDNFLEIAGIDNTFFDALPLDFQVDTVISAATDIGLLQPGQPTPAYRPIGRPEAPRRASQGPTNPGETADQRVTPQDDAVSVEQQQMQTEQENNMLFIESLDTGMRAEVLATCPDEFLMTLPDHIQAEARRLREQGFAEELEADEQEPQDLAGQFVHTNRIQQSIKKNKQRDLIRKHFGGKAPEAKLYPIDAAFLDVIIRAIADPVFQLQALPISHLSAILLEPERQAFFYRKLLDLVEESDSVVQLRAFTALEALSYSNFLFFHDKRNFDRLLQILRKYQTDEQLLIKLTRTLNHIVKTTLTQTETTENCDLAISQDNLDCLTCILYSKNQALFEALTVILFMLSFNVKNLELIIDSLQENIARLAFSLNMNFEEILRLDRTRLDRPLYFAQVASKLNEKAAMQNGILKIFKLLEQLFKRSFSLNFADDKEEEDSLSVEGAERPSVPVKDRKDEDKSSRFNEIKTKVLASFANYFKQTNIKLLFFNMFKVLNIYEPILEATIEGKKLSKPIFTKMLPLIESFFIIYKLLCDEEMLKSIKANLQLREIGSEDVQIAGFDELAVDDDADSVVSQSPQRFKTPTPDQAPEDLSELRQLEHARSRSRQIDFLDKLTIESLFFKGVRSNRNLFNYLLSQTPRISSSPLSVLIRHTPRFINFEIKRKYFNQTVQALRTKTTLKLTIKRSNIFHDSYSQISKKSSAQIRGKLNIKFQDEEGIDAGGVQREWYNELSKEIFNPNYALFIPAAHGYAYQPSPFSTVNHEHLSYFKFIGKMFGRALLDGNLMDAHFTRSFYKHMTGTPLNYTDLEDYDQDYFRTIKWILENDVETLDMDFTYEREVFGVKQIINLKPNGAKIPVTNDNKAEYVRLICEQKLTEEIRPQIKSFLEGLNSVIPTHLIKTFDPKELELMFSGMPEVDLQDLKDNTEYFDYNENSPVIQRFWEVMQEFDEPTKAGFLQFVTGTSKVPVEGFSHLRGMGGIQRFNIHKAFDTSKLPTSHTCMNQLDLPNYETKEELKDKLMKAILYGKEGFGFA